MDTRVGKLPSGITWRSMLAIVLGAAVLMPIWIYTTLALPFSVAANIIIIFLFEEFSRIFGKHLTKQELSVMYYFVLTAGAEGPFLSLIFNSYLIRHPLMKAIGVTPEIPKWYAPPPSSPSHYMRTLLSWDWLPPIILLLINIVTGLAASVALTFIFAQHFVEEESLPFPVAEIQASTILSFAEIGTERTRTRIFALTTAVGFIYGLFVYGLPLISEYILGFRISIIPIPFFDLTDAIRDVLPGAALGIVTDLATIASGLVVPFQVVVIMFITSIVVWVFGNSFAFSFPQIFPEWNAEKLLISHLDLQRLYVKAIQYNWISLGLGIGLAVGIIPTVMNWRILAKVIKAMARPKRKGAVKGPYMSLWTFLALYLGSTLSMVAITHYIVPQYPLWILLFLGVFWVYFSNLIAVRSVGETGWAFTIPFVFEGLTLASGYRRADIWFVPTIAKGGLDVAGAYTSGGASFSSPPIFVNAMRTFRITETDPNDFFKALIITLPLTLVFSFIYTEFFWRMAPVPSFMYPASTYRFPMQVINQALWMSIVKGKEIRLPSGAPLRLFKPTLILIGFTVPLIAQIIARVLKRNISIAAFAMGVGMIGGPSVPIGVMIGALIGRYFIRRRFGDEWYQKYRGTIPAGLGVGTALAIAIAVSLMMIGAGRMVLPY